MCVCVREREREKERERKERRRDTGEMGKRLKDRNERKKFG
jgi:hypothetical protein